MLGKGMIMFVLMILAIVGYLLYKHYRHEWGYDDDTVIHHYSLNHAPRTPPTTIRIKLAA
jgi:hypothetical protein